MVVLALAGIVAFLLGRERARNGFLLFIITLGLGFRTVAVTSALRIHPAEIALLLTLVMHYCEPAQRGSRGPTLPWWLWTLLPFMVLGWFVGKDKGYTWDERLSECRNIALAVPVFLAARGVLAKQSSWRPVVATFFAVGTVVAGLGMLEYFVPSVGARLAGGVSPVHPEQVQEGEFVRASFSFYGGAIAVFVCILSLPFGLAIWQWWPSARARLITAAAGLTQLAGLYISGYRSMWFTIGVLMGLFTLKKRSFTLALGLVVLAFIGSQFVSREARGRFESLVKLLEGTPDDSSGSKRFDRIKEAFDDVLEEPLGGGWASAGWVHSDFLQIAANLGILAGLTFLFGYLHTLYQLLVRLRHADAPEGLRTLAFPLVLSFLVAGQMLAVQGVEFQMFTILPLWLVWALVQTWLWQTEPAPEQRTQRPATARKSAALMRARRGWPGIAKPR
jgi:hypothetical protein